MSLLGSYIRVQTCEKYEGQYLLNTSGDITGCYLSPWRWIVAEGDIPIGVDTPKIVYPDSSDLSTAIAYINSQLP